MTMQHFGIAQFELDKQCERTTHLGQGAELQMCEANHHSLDRLTVFNLTFVWM